MDSPSVSPWLQRFDKSSRRFLCALMSGPQGALAAFHAFQHSQSGKEPQQDFTWQTFIENLCAQEPVLNGPEKTLVLKPVLLLLPVLCQRNLFSLLLLVQSAVPMHCLDRLLHASRQDHNPDLWVQRLRDLLQVKLQEKHSLMPVLLTETCQQQLKDLCQKLMSPHCNKPGVERKLSWYVKQADPCLVPSGVTSGCEPQIKKKKRGPEKLLNPEEERERKRSRLELDELDQELSEPSAMWWGADADSTGHEPVTEASGNEAVPSQSSPKEATAEKTGGSQSFHQDSATEVPEHIKVHVPKIKELLQMQFDDSDGRAPPELQVLNECTPSQLEGLCSLLQLSECPENELLHFCTWLVAFSPDLGFSNATVLAGKLFRPRVLLLTEPASWALTTALMMFCSKYARPICCTLIPSILQAPGKGTEQMKLVCKLIETCLEPEYVRLVFSQIVEVPWSEDLLSVVHSLLGTQVELSTDLFNVLVLNLCQMAQEFSKSMHYAKLVLTVLTNYPNNMTPTHQHRLSCAVDLNETILKKALQIALKRVTP